MLIIGAVPTFLPDMADGAADVTGNASYPIVLRLIFGFWWLPAGLLMIGVVTNEWQSISRRRRSRRSRRY